MSGYYLIVYGCQMNKADAGRIASVFEFNKIKQAENLKEARYVIIIACSVRQSAVNRIYGQVKNLLPLKKMGAKLILTGCLLKKDAVKLNKFFDLIIKIDDIKDLAKKLKIVGKKTITKNYLDLKPKIGKSTTVYVPISSGCNNFCSYCVVPYTRGQEYSRSAKFIIKEIKGLIKHGVKNIILIGQNVNSYKDKKTDFNSLLKKINGIKDDFFLHFITNHPKDTSFELLKTMKTCKKIGHYLHLPVQSGSNRILKLMNRHYTISEYKQIIKRARLLMPDINISTDIIVGFPTETEQDFKLTAALMKEARFDMVYIAEYSPRGQTIAYAKFKDNVSPKIKAQRRIILTEILKKTALKNNSKLIGKNLDVLLEKQNKDYFYGRTKNFKKIRIKINDERPCRLNKITKIKITKAAPWALEGKPI